MSHIFISYSRADKHFIDELMPLLNRTFADDKVWIDQDISGGVDWWKHILQAIAASDIFIYLLSNDSLESSHCQAEFSEALRLKKLCLPVIVRPKTEISKAPAKLEKEIRRREWVDMSGGFKDHKAITSLYAAINTLKKEIPVDVPKPLAPNPVSPPVVVINKTNSEEKNKMLQYEKIGEYSLDDWVKEFNEIYHPINQARKPSGIWLYVVEHAAAIHEALRTADFAGLRRQLPRVFCWLCAFVTSASQNAELDIKPSLVDIVLNKYPQRCFYCWQETCSCQSSFGAQIEDGQYKSDNKLYYRMRAKQAYKDLGVNKPQSIPDFTAMFKGIYGHKNFDMPIEILAAHFQEEIGEVCKDINQIYDQVLLGNIYGNHQVTHEDLEEEIADVFTWLIALYWKIDYILGGAKKYFTSDETREFPSLQEGFEELIWQAYADKKKGYMADPKSGQRPVPSPAGVHPEC